MDELFEKLERAQDSHKGENGKVLVIGGSEKYAGAPVLTAKAALRSGADLVKVLTAEKARPVVQGFSENLIVESYGESFDQGSLEKALELDEWADTTVVGPGLSDFEEDAMKKFGEEAGSLVVDAEAIGSLKDISSNIFTPHSVEAEILIEEFDSIESFASQKHNTVLLKGKIDKIYSKDGKFRNDTGCAGMTVGGTGDVLAGVVGAFRSQGLDDLEACRLGAYVNGKAGEKAFETYGNGLVATDIIDEIPHVVKEN